MRHTLKLIIPTAAIAALSVAAVAPSYAQTPGVTTTVKVKPKVTPSRAGTKKHPQTVKLDVRASLHTTGPDGLNKPVMQKLVILFPKGSKYNGGKAPKCSESKMNRGLPKRVCPKGSIMGSGSGHAWADTEKVKAGFTLVNGGKKHVYVFTTMTNPALVQLPVPGTIKKMRGKWAYKATFTVPRELQVVAGIPISLIDLHIKTNKNAKKRDWLQTTSCPKNHRWPFRATGTFMNPGDNSVYNVEYDSKKEHNSVKCKAAKKSKRHRR